MTLNVSVGRERVPINKKTFEKLLDVTYIKESSVYKKTISSGKISLSNLKAFAQTSGIPYPLFFAPDDIVDRHIKIKDQIIFQKIPSKEEIAFSTRGLVDIKDIELILLDLSRKQDFLKRRITQNSIHNTYIGSLKNLLDQRVSVDEIARLVRASFEIDLVFLRSISKPDVLKHLINKVEAKNILVSLSSHNYMPHNLDRELMLSGFCVKDKKFPYIFINTRDGDDNPRIIESEGRQIFTLMSMLVCIGFNQFFLSSKATGRKGDVSKISYSIASRILLPKDDLSGIAVDNLETLKEKAHYFRVTPSMLLYNLKELRIVNPDTYTSLQILLKQEQSKASVKSHRRVGPVTGYSKYNGQRFSTEVVRACDKGVITKEEMRNILFRKGGKMDNKLLADYQTKFKRYD